MPIEQEFTVHRVNSVAALTHWRSLARLLTFVGEEKKEQFLKLDGNQVLEYVPETEVALTIPVAPDPSVEEPSASSSCHSLTVQMESSVDEPGARKSEVMELAPYDGQIVTAQAHQQVQFTVTLSPIEDPSIISIIEILLVDS